MINFFKNSINYFERNLLFLFMALACVLIFALLYQIKIEGRKITLQSIADMIKRMWAAMEFKKKAKLCWKEFFNPWGHYKELRDMKKVAKR